MQGAQQLYIFLKKRSTTLFTHSIYALRKNETASPYLRWKAIVDISQHYHLDLGVEKIDIQT